MLCEEVGSGKRAKAQLKALDARSCYRLGIDGYIRLTETLQQLFGRTASRLKRSDRDRFLNASRVRWIPVIDKHIHDLDRIGSIQAL
jgi:hypothetical protein